MQICSYVDIPCLLYTSFEKELLKKNPLDRRSRIIRMVYLNQDLTESGTYLFPRLMQKFLVFTDRGGKTSLETRCV